jgi:hypothetical protein
MAVILPHERERTMAQDHMTVFPCPFPYQVFANEEEGMAWLIDQ